MFLFSPAFYMLSTERRRHDVHVLFGDVSYDVINAHWHVNNKIKRKLTLTTIKIFISFNENIHIFTRASHSWKYWCFHYTRWQYLWYSQPKSKYSLYIHLWQILEHQHNWSLQQTLVHEIYLELLFLSRDLACWCPRPQILPCAEQRSSLDHCYYLLLSKQLL